MDTFYNSNLPRIYLYLFYFLYCSEFTQVNVSHSCLILPVCALSSSKVKPVPAVPVFTEWIIWYYRHSLLHS